MRSGRSRLLIALVALPGLVLWAQHGAARRTSRAEASPSGPAASETSKSGGAAPVAEPRSVVVELFTSQGCSSCPPADRLLSELRESGAAAGVEVIALSFHVDYWNYIGWTDPFSSAEWSQRQQRYGEALGLDTIYTPQLVADGHLECVGSSRRLVTRLLADAATPDEVTVSLALDAGGAAQIAVRGAGGSELEVWLAVWEDGLVTPVGDGENARKTLTNDAVVRSFELVGALSGHERVEWSRPLRLDEGWRPDRLGVAVIVQDPRTMRIHGSASLDLPAS